MGKWVMDWEKPVTLGELRDVFAALLLASMKTMNDAQRIQLRKALRGASEAAADGGRPKSAAILEELARMIEVARSHLPPG